MLLILLGAFGYYYFKDPSTVPEKIKESMETMKSGFNDVENKSKTLYKDSKELYKKTKDSSGDVNKLLKDSNKEAEKEFKK